MRHAVKLVAVVLHAGACTPSSDVRTTSAPSSTTLGSMPSMRTTAASWGTGAATAGPPREPRPPSGVAASVAPPQGSPTPAADETQQFLGRLRASLRRCYGSALDRNPALAVSPRFSIDVGADGQVTDVRVTGTEADPALGRCLREAIQKQTFPPALSGTTLALPTAESSP